MDDQTSKIRLKIGMIEIEYEGITTFLRDDLADLMQKLLTCYSEHKAAIPAETAVEQEHGRDGGAGPREFTLSTSTIATRLGVGSGPDLALAASAHLAVVKKKDKFTRKELNDEMKTATTYFKANMTSNLSSILNALIKTNKLNEVATGVYALSAAEKTNLETKLAQSS
ncbi:MAG TPA: hypothetical protein VGS13_14900 [Stellaceae bacterium]|nr:hypothetical protein [Stellaceae bacterium]